MLAMLHAVREQVDAFKKRRSLLSSLNELERELHEILLTGNSKLSSSLLVALFRVEVRNAKILLARGSFTDAQRYRDEASRTCAYVRNIARPQTRRTRHARAQSY